MNTVTDTKHPLPRYLVVQQKADREGTDEQSSRNVPTLDTLDACPADSAIIVLDRATDRVVYTWSPSLGAWRLPDEQNTPARHRSDALVERVTQ